MSPPRALYIHVPLCRARCGYCDFYSEVITPGAVEPLVDALCAEWARLATMRTPSLETIFIGGGTPTILPAPALRRLLDAIVPAIDHPDTCEFTVEANPATVTTEVADTLAAAGVNRVSIGAQSFQPAELATLERLHQPDDVARTVETCRQAGIHNISLDLIFGIPGQSMDTWEATLDHALQLHPQHLSSYGLTYEPGTRLQAAVEARKIEPIDNDLEAAMYEHAIDRLATRGMPQYEISNFARPGFQCRHNLVYWDNRPYLGVGPAAAGYVDGIRYRNIADTAAYVDAIHNSKLPWCEHEHLDDAHRARETAMLALRRTHGIDCADFQKRFGVPPEELFADAIAQHTAAGLLIADDDRVRLTRAGLLLADRVIADFL